MKNAIRVETKLESCASDNPLLDIPILTVGVLGNCRGKGAVTI
jgi:hypothetical protein